MKQLLASTWDMFLVRGILAILFGIATLLMPGITPIVLVVLFGGYALVDGFILSVLAFKNRKNDSYWWLPLRRRGRRKVEMMVTKLPLFLVNKLLYQMSFKAY